MRLHLGQSRADLQAVHPHPFDLILCGDLVYHPELVRPLLDALDALAPNDATAALLACRCPGKMPQQEAVLTGLQALGFRLTRGCGLHAARHLPRASEASDDARAPFRAGVGVGEVREEEHEVEVDVQALLSEVSS